MDLAAFAILVIVLSPFWIPLAIATFPVWGLALLGIFGKDVDKE